MFEMLDETFDDAFAPAPIRPFARSFLTDGTGIDDPDKTQPLLLPLYVTPLAPEQEQQRILIISSPIWVRETIHELYARGFANPNDWSRPMPGANPGEVVSILTRRRQRRRRE
jgi:NAD(P)H-flavin reductase